MLIDPDVPYERILFYFSPKTLHKLSTPDADLSECFTHNSFSVYHYPRSVRNNILTRLDRLAALQNEGSFGRLALGRACLTELFVEINQCNRNQSVFSFNKETKDTQMVEVIRQYILDHIADPISIDDLADYVYMSRFNFMRRFKQCGFGDYSAFYRAFLQEYGVSPRVYSRDLPASSDAE